MLCQTINTGEIHLVPSGCLTKTGDSTIASLPNLHLKISSKQKTRRKMKNLSVCILVLLGIVFLTAIPVVQADKYRRLKKDSSSSSSKSKKKKGNTPKPTGSPTESPKCDGKKCLNKFYSWTSGALEIFPTMEKITSVITSLKGNIDGHFTEVTSPLLTQDECSRLRSFADERLQEELLLASNAMIADKKGDDEYLQYGDDIREDFRFHVTVDELLELVSLDSIRAMYDAFKAHDSNYHVSGLVLRRSHHDSNDRHIQYHQDGQTSVMHVWLNEDDIDGGNLYYLNRNGTTKFDTALGTAAFHSDSIVHGVSGFKGTRYIFIFIGDLQTDILKDVIASDGGTIKPGEPILVGAETGEL